MSFSSLPGRVLSFSSRFPLLPLSPLPMSLVVSLLLSSLVPARDPGSRRMYPVYPLHSFCIYIDHVPRAPARPSIYPPASLHI
ncbi:hypothetical protein C8Q77DRAFT_909928 [Trametes polyzona]|nr:hypothetical protein C8Q77DRAFT_909928 [Trametes polyzona]